MIQWCEIALHLCGWFCFITADVIFDIFSEMEFH